MASDDLYLGPKARMGIALLDSSDKDTASIAVSEIGRGGRQHSKSENDVQKFCGQATVPPDVAKRTSSVVVTVHITGIGTKLVGIRPGGVIDQSEIAVSVPQD
jgi:hypothetical protein